MSTPRFAHGPVLMNMHLGMQIPRFPNLCWNCLAPITVTSNSCSEGRRSLAKSNQFWTSVCLRSCEARQSEAWSLDSLQVQQACQIIKQIER